MTRIRAPVRRLNILENKWDDVQGSGAAITIEPGVPPSRASSATASRSSVGGDAHLPLGAQAKTRLGHGDAAAASGGGGGGGSHGPDAAVGLPAAPAGGSAASPRSLLEPTLSPRMNAGPRAPGPWAFHGPHHRRRPRLSA